MKGFKLFLGLVSLSILLVSCKNNEKDATKTPIESKAIKTADTTQKKGLTEVDKKVITSVFNKLMTTPELKTFVSLNVTAGTFDILSKEDGPFTILGPSNEAFQVLPEAKMKPLHSPEYKNKLEKLIKNHVVKGNFTSADLVQNMSTSGSVTLNTLGGATLTASKDGNDIIITDAAGNKAKLGKTDILAGNGVVHVMDAVLNAE